MELTDIKSAVDQYADAAETSMNSLQQRLEDVEMKMERPALLHSQQKVGETSLKSSHKHSFLRDFMIKGDASALRHVETKALSTTTGGDGGFAVPEIIDSQIEHLLKQLSPLRSLVKVKNIETSDYKKLVSIGGASSGWIGETGNRNVTDSPALKEIAITPGEIYANAAATQRALDDLQFDAESWLMDEVAEEFSLQESAAMVIGDGHHKPRGFLTAIMSDEKDEERDFGAIQFLSSGVEGAFPSENPADLLIDLIHCLKARYRKGAVFLMNSKTLSLIRKFKDSDGHFLWKASLKEGAPSLLLGYPVYEVEEMPDVANNSLSIAFGNFERGYLLVERSGTRVLRDPYSNKPYVHFYATRRIGGAVINSEAIKILKFGAT
ncbi:phage major capsid protein [Temperatibacter marinus]|uniref:Phage major capsid protein n=1 Tax=Temperatibacter marinus TaxID=1456591 RepID=A0AA52H8P2_9PROT|nr:phage major capsid protein [Temperatibacter marinus]WND02049.1 phage major capsid protein [Temperatibacter marinus]